jgi:hypothetical protein
VLFDARGVITLTTNAWVDQTGAAHGASFGPAPIVIDTVARKRVVLADVVKDERAFHDALAACDGWDAELDWGPDTFRKAPRFELDGDGVSIVMGDLAGPMHGMEGSGLHASFAALAGHGMLRADSPVARLWAGVKPAPGDAPLCSRIGDDAE